MKWTIEELDGMEAVEGVEANPGADPPVEEVIAVEGKEGNQLLRNAEMIQLATDGLCREFKIHCDFTNVNLRNIDFPTLEVEVQHWQRNTTTGKTFTAACTPANHGTKHTYQHWNYQITLTWTKTIHQTMLKQVQQLPQTEVKGEAEAIEDLKEEQEEEEEEEEEECS